MQGSFSFLSPLAIFHPLTLGLDSPFYRKQTSHLKAPFLYLSLLIFPCLSPPTNQIHFKSAPALLSWQSFEIALSQFLLFFFPVWQFFQLAPFRPQSQSCIETLSKMLPIIIWMQCEEGTWPEQLGGQKFRVLDLGSLLTGVTTGSN